MIFYFTGTGNSQYAAEHLAIKSNEKMISIAEEMRKKDHDFKYSLKKGERLGIVFPIYAWAAPKIVTDFISKMDLIFEEMPYVYAIATCGANVGDAFKSLTKHLKSKQLNLSSSFSLIMPNNYIIVGDVDGLDEQARKLNEAEKKLNQWTPFILEKTIGVEDIIKGPLPYLMTHAINPLFHKNAIKSSKFTVNDACTHCGICKNVCPVDNVALNDFPIWGNRCIQCLACIHYCPVRAIDYGNSTHKKGRYTHPTVKRL